MRKTTQTAPGSKKRQVLIDTFIEIASKEGVARVTLQQTAKKAKIAFATAHHYFGNERANLLEESIRSVAERAQTFIEDWLRQDPDRRVYPLRSYIAGTIEWIRKHPAHASIWVYYYHVLAYDPRWRKGHAPVLESARDRVRQLITESIGIGMLPGGTLREDTARQVHALIVGGTMLGIVHGTERPEAALRWILDGCEALLGGEKRS
jgi:AcrR family transcriptional regulator